MFDKKKNRILASSRFVVSFLHCAPQNLISKMQALRSTLLLNCHSKCTPIKVITIINASMIETTEFFAKDNLFLMFYHMILVFSNYKTSTFLIKRKHKLELV